MKESRRSFVLSFLHPSSLLFTILFSRGIIAGSPLCCQQRPVPRTRRWQGVPFCVRAPQIVIISSGSVGRSVTVPSGP